METRVALPTEENIALAARLLQEGRLVAFPTETVYGLGANALDADATRAIFAAKGRPADNPLIVHVCEPAAADAISVPSDAARALMDAFWPGPLTLLMPKKPCIPAVVNAGLPSVAVRMPSHPVARRMLRACGLPIAAPSANTSGRPSPTTAAHVLCDLDGRVPLILDGGACAVGVESTVLDMTSDIPTVLRPGGVTPEMLLTVLAEVRVADSVMRPLKEGERALSPGMRYRHYAPRGALTIVKGEPARVAAYCREACADAERAGRKPCVLRFDEHAADYAGLFTRSLGRETHPEEAASLLFAILREMDDLGRDAIFSEAVPATGVGLALMNRLARAAAFHVVEVGGSAPHSPC